jgi:ABC-type Fe3+-hydroxamate transport system substrate-binding protein
VIYRDRGGIDIFADRRNQGAAKERIVKIEEVVEQAPDLIIVRSAARNSGPSAARTTLALTPAVQRQDLYEINPR